MKIRDISLRKRLLIVNFLMVLIPVCVIVAMGWLIFAGIRFIDTGQNSALISNFLSEKDSSRLVQIAVNSIKNTAEKHDTLKLKSLQKDFRVLESQGISVVIFQDKKITYSTPNSNVEEIKQISRNFSKPSIMIWSDEGFFFKYTAKKFDALIFATGNIPLDEQKIIPKFPLKKISEVIGTILFIFVVIFIIFLGKYLSKILSRQIIEPLEKMREVASKIREGNLDFPLEVESNDEIGETCREFDKMRVELRENKILREKYELNRKELLAGISHDLATPLTAIKGYASGILEGIAKTPEKKLHYVEMINQTVGEMENLVENLFMFSKLDLGRIEFQFESVNLSEFFSDFLSEKKEIFSERGLNLSFEGETNKKVLIDRLQFTRLVNNLLENSIKYKKNDAVNVEIKISEEKNNLRVSFSDDGRGVADDELEKIFEIFYRADKSRTKVAKGSGLGLAIVKQIAEGMNGKIFAEKSLSGGLTIIFEIPIVE